MALPGKLLAFAASARIANAPSVVVNVWLGIALALAFSPRQSLPEMWQTSAWLCVSGLLLYLAGNLLNDWADRQWDAIHRPERALPRRLFPPSLYLTLAVSCGASGIGLAALAALPSLAVALAVVLFIGLYTWTHKRSVWSVIPMASCRAALPVLGFFGFHTNSADALPALALAATGVFCHIAGLSISARNESPNRPPNRQHALAILLFGGTIAAMASLSIFYLNATFPLTATSALPYLAWLALAFTIFRAPVHAHVSSLLAGIPLVDWIPLIPLSFLLPAPISTICLWLPPVAFLAARMLQRLASAT